VTIKGVPVSIACESGLSLVWGTTVTVDPGNWHEFELRPELPAGRRRGYRNSLAPDEETEWDKGYARFSKTCEGNADGGLDIQAKWVGMQPKVRDNPRPRSLTRRSG